MSRWQVRRAHHLEQAGDVEAAISEYRAAGARTTNLRERHHMRTQAARLGRPRLG